MHQSLIECVASLGLAASVYQERGCLQRKYNARLHGTRQEASMSKLLRHHRTRLALTGY